MDEFQGQVERITFYNPENHFTVAKLKNVHFDKEIAVVGKLSDVKPGEFLNCRGSWKQDPKHGKQFIVQSFEKKAPATLVGIKKYLSSGIIKGMGPKFAEKIIQKFGLQTLDVIEKSPQKLLHIEGLGKKKLEHIIECIEAHRAIQDTMVFLQSHEITPAYAHKIFKKYGSRCAQIIQENPYGLARDIAGIGFKMADRIAGSLKIDPLSKARLSAGIEYVLSDLSSQGHACYLEDELTELTCDLLKAPSEHVSKATSELIEEKRLHREVIHKKSYIWLKPLFIAEQGIVNELTRLTLGPCAFRTVKCREALEWVEKQTKFKFASAQKEAITAALQEKFLVITGGPGTGKSTITKAILKILSQLSKRIILAAPTGKAAKRMSEITFRHASTIHSLLEFDFKDRKFKRNQENPLTCDLIVIDEASMIDTYIMQHLLKAIPDQCRVLLIGDIDQLPSVGPGNVLRDIIDSKKITTKKLKFIFRQQKGSKIISSAHAINDGYFPKLQSEPGDDFFFIEKKEPSEVLQTIVHLCTQEIPQKNTLNPINDIQVLSPMKKGIIGTENLNVSLQKVLNPTHHYLHHLGKQYAIGDKVMQYRNNYQKEVFNGDVGVVSNLDKAEGQLVVCFEGRDVIYELSELDEINLAYAVSIHKYQGSEAPCVIIPVHTHHFKLLCRNLLYTGVTRGKKLVYLVGTKKALAISIHNNEIEKRYTALKNLLESSQVTLEAC